MPLRRCLASLLLLALTLRAPAQPDWPDREHGPRVILFEHAGYRGGALVIYPGDVIENLSGAHFDSGRAANDAVSSIKVEGGATIVVYADADFRGPALRLTENVRDLSERFLPGGGGASWNDRISSLRVEGGRERRPPPVENRRVDSDVIIKRSFQDVLLREPGEADYRQYRSYLIDQGWTEAMLRDQLRQSEEYRRDAVDRIIRRAYHDILGREPDPTGLRSYHRLMLEKNWGENELRDDLRRSAEYRSKHGGK